MFDDDDDQEERRREIRELREANRQSMQELQADIERRKRVVILESHRRPEPEEQKSMSTLTDFQIAQMVAALKAETASQLTDHHEFLKALIGEVYTDLFKTMKREIAKLRREIAELRTEFDDRESGRGRQGRDYQKRDGVIW